MNITEEDFRELLASVIDELPEFFRRKMDNVYVVVEDFARPEVLAGQGIASPMELLGLYEGYPLKSRGSHYSNVLPDRITLYRRPIMAGSRTRDEVKRRARGVFTHELAHHFGFSEDELSLLEEDGRGGA